MKDNLASAKSDMDSSKKKAEEMSEEAENVEKQEKENEGQLEKIPEEPGEDEDEASKKVLLMKYSIQRPTPRVKIPHNTPVTKSEISPYPPTQNNILLDEISHYNVRP